MTGEADFGLLCASQNSPPQKDIIVKSPRFFSHPYFLADSWVPTLLLLGPPGFRATVADSCPVAPTLWWRLSLCSLPGCRWSLSQIQIHPEHSLWEFSQPLGHRAQWMNAPSGPASRGAVLRCTARCSEGPTQTGPPLPELSNAPFPVSLPSLCYSPLCLTFFP